MHELGIAQSIVDSALGEAGRTEAKKVTTIEIEVGELMQVDVQAPLSDIPAKLVYARGSFLTLRTPIKY